MIRRRARRMRPDRGNGMASGTKESPKGPNLLSRRDRALRKLNKSTACAIGAVCCLPWAGQLADQLGTASAGSIAGMVYLGAVPTALAFSTWAYALARMDAGSLGVSTYLVPPIVILLGWLFLAEVPPALAFAGGAVCLLGVALSRRRSRRADPLPVAEAAGPVA